ncbi:TrmH family RNA methyltransferase [Aliidiomarina quisquiliarum]|uniref:TrmH family RNA methyltransferase n=1 Tax=Aliidiomarina quisquiliarum TaxID=2938947 RepID=UPI00208F2DFE|nr:RNA methyltransferase [Aliidiomarina quisquiliarum]MCO4320531.1 RNA methyltransferase [Aliidiomarina quisquiliarum]
MLTNNHKKLVKGLQQIKQRDKHGCFVAEGPKVIGEFIQAGFELRHLFATDAALFSDQRVIEVSPQELKTMSYLTTANACLAVFSIPTEKQLPDSGLKVALDAVRDPGNLGTIIRLCDWFGITQLVCAADTVDCYNPKVVQATMGSLARVNVVYLNLQEYLADTQLPIYGAFMDGGSVYQQTLPENAILVMGNEANGIRSPIEALVTERISIPRFGALQETESLNVATATAIILSEFKRGTA